MDRHALRIWAAWMVFEVWLQVAYRLQFIASYKWFLVGPIFSDSASCVWFLRVLHFGINFCLLYFCCLSIVFSVQTIRYKQFDQALVREILMIGLWTNVQWTIGRMDEWTTEYRDMKRGSLNYIWTNLQTMASNIFSTKYYHNNDIVSWHSTRQM